MLCPEWLHALYSVIKVHFGVFAMCPFSPYLYESKRNTVILNKMVRFHSLFANREYRI